MITKKKVINKNFVLYLTGRMVSDTGTSIQMMIMPLYILDVGGTAATIGLFSFFSFLPALMIYPFAGVIGDRLNRKAIMVATDLISAAIILLMAMLAYWGYMNTIILLTAQVMVILLNGLFEPATRGMLPQLVAKEKATQSNALVSSMRSASIMLGPVIGAALYGRFGIVVVFLANGVSFLLSGISEMMIQYTHTKRALAGGAAGIIKELLEGIGFILANKVLSKLCLFFLLNYIIVQPIFQVILPLFFKAKLNYSDLQYGYLQMVIIGGALLGSLLVGVVFGKDDSVKRPLLWGAGLVLGGMLLYAVLLLPGNIDVLGNNTAAYFMALAAVLCLLSIASTFVVVPMQGFIQKETPDQFMSRVFSMISLLSRGGIPLGALIYGIILEKVEIYKTVMAATILMGLVTFAFVGSLFKEHDI